VSNQHSVTKGHRRPKSGKRTDYTARTMAAVKQLAQAAKLSESQRQYPNELKRQQCGRDSKSETRRSNGGRMNRKQAGINANREHDDPVMREWATRKTAISECGAGSVQGLVER
jgi:hypothetical protein